MQAVILAAGRGSRMGELTQAAAKAMLVVSGKTLLEHKLDILPAEITEVIVVTGHASDEIKNRFGTRYGKIAIRYAEQPQLNGTAGALWSARDMLGDRFVVMMGDDLYSRRCMNEIVGYPFAMAVSEQPGFLNAGNIIADSRGFLQRIDFMRDAVPAQVHLDTGIYALTREIFNYQPVPIPGKEEEFGLPHTLEHLAKDIPVKVLKTDFWMKINRPEDLERAERYFVQHAEALRKI